MESTHIMTKIPNVSLNLSLKLTITKERFHILASKKSMNFYTNLPSYIHIPVARLRRGEKSNYSLSFGPWLNLKFLTGYKWGE